MYIGYVGSNPSAVYNKIASSTRTIEWTLKARVFSPGVQKIMGGGKTRLKHRKNCEWCQSLTLNVRVGISQFVRYSQLVVTK